LTKELCFYRKSFDIREVASLFGIIVDICSVSSFKKYPSIIMQYSICEALKVNIQFIFTSKKFKRFTDLISSKDNTIFKFFQKKLTREIKIIILFYISE